MILYLSLNFTKRVAFAFRSSEWWWLSLVGSLTK